ncbi:NYN domain-containing protein [Aquella oligotrophica]|uniref:HTH OST-type domain-containing protein n=1 Tax=Aquella oligotrophica TaxID=2067065 RepID=A0A2I7N4R4_9NEIS|nr:NYN domain-containing protein [Aquella oligotrophica]AUR51452.1 hypothetical protein CUN60_03825 [Aquella oligotrophica]
MYIPKQGEEANLHLAVLIDADNAQASVIEALLAEVARYGEATVKRIYGDFTSKYSSQWKSVLNKFAIKPVQQFAYTKGKNATDSTMIIDAMDLLYTKRFDGFCIVSSDSDFTGLAMRIREEGLWVYGFGEEKTPAAFRNACHKFIRTENLRLEGKGEDEILALEVASEEKVKEELANSENLSKENSGDISQNINKESVKKRFPLALATRAVEESSGDDGWAQLGGFGSYLTRVKPDFDPRDYGYDKLSNLVKARRNIFEIEERPSSNPNQKNLYLRIKIDIKKDK